MATSLGNRRQAASQLQQASGRSSAARRLHLTKRYFYSLNNADDICDDEPLGCVSHEPPSDSPQLCHQDLDDDDDAGCDHEARRAPSHSPSSDSRSEQICHQHLKAADRPLESANIKPEVSSSPSSSSANSQNCTSDSLLARASSKQPARGVNKLPVARRPSRASEKPSLEEQLRHILELEPRVKEETEGGAMKKSSGRPPVDDRLARYNQEQVQQQQRQLEQLQYQRPKRNTNYQGDRGISPSDRLMIFMLASRSAQTDSAVERDARILKWLNNCRSAS